jgi:hypothetical protein
MFEKIKSPVGEVVSNESLRNAGWWVATNETMEVHFLYNQELESSHCFGPNAFAEYLDTRKRLWLL